ncbi:MAG TPA: hypothetical protein DCS30_01685 [Rhizobiales bacterium]|nr:hypothetical protein [Hyphomicrobiales bacterium]
MTGVLTSLLLAGCASSGSLGTSDANRSIAVPVSSVDQSSLPPLDNSEAGKFSQSDDGSLVVTQAASELVEEEAAAYQSSEQANQISNRVVSANSKMLGSWVVQSRSAKTSDRLSKLTAMANRLFDHSESARSQICQVQFGSDPVEGGYKADGAASCPTMLFMLESWRPYGDKVILKNHMGDEIMRLTSRSGDLWVGVDEKGQTFTLKRPAGS